MRELSIGTQQRDIQYDPTNRIANNAAGNYVPGPFEIADDILFGSVNFILSAIDDITGLDLLSFATLLEGMFSPGALLTKLVGFLNPISLIGSAAGVLGPLLTGGLFTGGLIPGLDASKIISGVFGLGQLPSQVLTTITGVASSLLSGVLGAGLIPGLDASKIISGAFSLAQLPLTVLNSVTGVASSLISGVLGAGNIPGLDASKIISGVFGLGSLPATVLNSVTGVASSLISGVLGAGNIPGLDASKIVSGVFGLASLPATVLNSVTGVASSLISGVLGLTHIPSLPTSQITSGIFGAGFIPGLDASKITSGIFGLASLPATVLNSVTGVASSLISGLLGLGNIPNLPASQTTTGIFGSGLIPGLDASKITSGNFAQSIVTGLTTDLTTLTSTAQGIIDGVVNNLTNVVGSLWPQAQADAALKAQAAATAATAAAIALLQGNNNQSNTGGINQFVDFSTFPDTTNLPSIFTETYYSGLTNSWGLSGGAVQDTSPQGFNQTGVAVGVYNVMTTVSDYQKVGGIWAGAPGISYNNPTPFFLPTPWSGPYIAEHHLYVRWKDVNNWVRVRFTAGDTVGNTPFAILECRVAGVITNFTTIVHGFQPNNAYFLCAGTGGGLNIFQVFLGTTPIITYTDASNVAGVGALYRSGAVGRQANGAQSAGVPAPPGPLTAFTIQDNNPTGSHLGKQIRYYRANAAGVAGSNGAPGMTPNNLFDTADFNTGGVFTFAGGSNCRITVSEKGRYEITYHAGLGGFTDHIGYLWKNGVIVKRGDRYTAETHCVWSIDLAAGDYINVGDHMVGAQNYIGDAGGTLMYLEMRQVLGVQ